MKKQKTTPAPKPTLTPRKKTGVREKISLTIEPEVLAWVDERADNRSEQINGDLTRYYRLLADARTQLRARLSPAEMSAIIDVSNGHVYAPRLSHYEFSANIEDACRLEGLADKWSIDGRALVDTLTALDLWQLTALADAISRWWHAVGEGDATRDPARALD